jgi:HD superfamily phosphohydrolase
MNNLSKSYYLEPFKNIRDLIHGYINLTQFELKIIDTVSFQRLKDIRQLTCQEVYPAARHTRFEHSLGVLQLTKNALQALNNNGYLNSVDKSDRLLSDSLIFNVQLAALLHDVGHCPFSHLGEGEFDPKYVKKYFFDLLKDEKYNISIQLKNKIEDSEIKDIAAIHEVLSCILILECYYDSLSNMNVTSEGTNDNCVINIDYDLIIRCILGIEYVTSNTKTQKTNCIKNVCIRLINSKIFDMDKLDYIMRDSYFTGIGAPQIDTNRLFNNMYFDSNHNMIFSRKAVPALQNMIDARDALYMYVYNHHAVVLSDFFYTYIIRKLSHNAESFVDLVYYNLDDNIKKDILDALEISRLGLIPKSYLFSVESIIQQNRSDSDWISLMNVIYSNQKLHINSIDLFLDGAIDSEINYYNSYGTTKIKPADILEDKRTDLCNKIKSTFQLVEKYKSRDFLKPWWKTVYEFSNFINYHFRDDTIRKNLCKWICSGGDATLDASEFRSEIAKQVICITQQIFENEKETGKKSGLLQPLNDGDFFVVQRSNRFFTINVIEDLNIALKTNDIIESNNSQSKHIKNYFLKSLTKIIPQKDYSTIYAQEGFYVYSKKLLEENYTENQKKKHYELIERIFVAVSTNFAKMGELAFVEFFQNNGTHPSIEKHNFTKNIIENLYK